MNPIQTTTTLKERYSGILLHPTSLPSPYGIGDFGQDCRDFIDYLVRAGQKLWQVLPLGPTGYGNSPYSCYSAFAGQPLLISPDRMVADGLLTEKDLLPLPKNDPKKADYDGARAYKTRLFQKAYENFKKITSGPLREDYERFCEEQSYWLADYALFMALKDANDGASWLDWPDDMRIPTPAQRKALADTYRDAVGYHCFVQFLFFRQWMSIKAYANESHIRIIGDAPIFVALDSADVWANKHLYQLDSKGYPLAVSGVPPDYFSATGQLWGNPLYDWEARRREDYKWWNARVRQLLTMVDIVRIDHFRGFAGYWSVPYGEKTAVNGEWKEGPGAYLFQSLERNLGKDLPIWAEDLGVITEDVTALRDKFAFPGMKVLQFAFEDPNDNEMMPHHHIENSICYTGTHDNDTSRGWYNHAGRAARKKARMYMNTGAADITWAFIRTALASNARYCVIPMQDVLDLDSDCRMNTPGTAEGNWTWRFTADQLDPDWTAYLAKLTRLYNR